MARKPFKMRSGNTTPFKQMGSSPIKHETTTSTTAKTETIPTIPIKPLEESTDEQLQPMIPSDKKSRIEHSTPKDTSYTAVKEARERGKDRVKAAREEFGRGSKEVKAAKKLKRERVLEEKISRKARYEAKIAANPELESWWSKTPDHSMFGTGSPKDMADIRAQYKKDTANVRATRKKYGRGSEEVKTAKQLRKYNQQTLFGENNQTN